MGRQWMTKNEYVYFFKKNRQSNVIDIHSLNGADCDIDHYLVVSTIRDRLSLKKGIKQQMVADWNNVNKLIDHKTRKQHQIDISE